MEESLSYRERLTPTEASKYQALANLWGFARASHFPLKDKKPLIFGETKPGRDVILHVRPLSQ